MHLQAKRVAITGASSGIGKAVALEAARRGAHLLLAARSEPALREVAEVARGLGAADAQWRACDVTRESDVEALAAAWPDVDVLVANAGVGQYGAFLDLPIEETERVLETNLLGVLRTVRAFGPAISKSKGHVLVVGSQAGKTPVPYSSVYAASKWALTGWTRSVRPELAARGVTITLFSPGPVDTAFRASRRLAEGVDAQTGGRKLPASQPVERVARQIVRAIERRAGEVDSGLPWGVGRALAGAAPESFASALAKRQR